MIKITKKSTDHHAIPAIASGKQLGFPGFNVQQCARGVRFDFANTVPLSVIVCLYRVSLKWDSYNTTACTNLVYATSSTFFLPLPRCPVQPSKDALRPTITFIAFHSSLRREYLPITAGGRRTAYGSLVFINARLVLYIIV